MEYEIKTETIDINEFIIPDSNYTDYPKCGRTIINTGGYNCAEEIMAAILWNNITSI